MSRFVMIALVIGTAALYASRWVSSATIETPEALPLEIPATEWRPLRGLQDPSLHKELVTRLTENLQWATLIESQKFAVAVVDLRDPRTIRFASVNGDTMMYAASLPKIAILLAACQAFQDGTLFESPRNVDDLHDMIRFSSNGAATRMIGRLGFKKIEAVLTDPQYALFDPSVGGGLWVGKAYAKSGRAYRDPIKSLSHGASATQVARFYYLLATGKLINRDRCQQMLTLMSDPAEKHKFVYSLEKIAPHATVYRKSGTWKKWHADSALVWDDNRRYILVGLVEDGRGEYVLRGLVPTVDDMLRW